MLTEASPRLAFFPLSAHTTAGGGLPLLLRFQYFDHHRQHRRRRLMGYIEGARENHVKKKVEEALRSKMKQKALKECDALTRQYAECAAGRTISVIWKCRREAKELNECLHQYTNDNVLEEMKRSYLQEQEGKVPA